MEVWATNIPEDFCSPDPGGGTPRRLIEEDEEEEQEYDRDTDGLRLGAVDIRCCKTDHGNDHYRVRSVSQEGRRTKGVKGKNYTYSYRNPCQ